MVHLYVVIISALVLGMLGGRAEEPGGFEQVTADDPLAVRLVVMAADAAESNGAAILELRHSEVLGGRALWGARVLQFASEYRHGDEGISQLEAHIESVLRRYGYPERLVQAEMQAPIGGAATTTSAVEESWVTSHDAVTRLLLASSRTGDYLSVPSKRFHEAADDSRALGPFEPAVFQRHRTHDVAQFVNSIALARELVAEHDLFVSPTINCEDKLTLSLDVRRPYSSPHQRKTPSQSPPPQPSPLPESASTTLFIIYQSIGAATGGSMALQLLHEQLVGLGFSSLVCRARNRLLEARCSDPPVSAILITGEWCHEVLRDYGVQNHRGRALQYHLGFHHDDACRGHVAIAASHYLTALLQDRVLGGYYLSAPMHAIFKTSLAQLLHKGARLARTDRMFFEHSGEADLSDLSGDARKVAVFKENLIVIDMDLITDYSPEVGVPFEIPAGYRVVHAKDILPEEMPLLLQRAKLLIDLAMPGPERLSFEAILMGAIPIVSNRWNGASDVDFPGLLRVDQQNSTSMTENIAHVIKNYDTLLDDVHMGRFFAQALSLWHKARETTQIVASSASVHFILLARNLREEGFAVLRLFALIFMYPLATFDIYVVDVMWFVRHHYAAVVALKAGGYLRRDIMDPRDENMTTTFYPTARNASSDGDESEADRFGGASMIRIQRLDYLESCQERQNCPACESGVIGRLSRDPALFRLLPPWAETVVAFFPSSSEPGGTNRALMFVEPTIMLDTVDKVREGAGTGGGVVKIVLSDADKTPLAAVMSASAASLLHACEPLAVRPTMLHDFLMQHRIFTHIEGMPFQEIAVDSLAVMELDDALTAPNPAHANFLGGLLSSPGWLSLKHYYLETQIL